MDNGQLKSIKYVICVYFTYLLTTKPLRVVLVCPHCISLGQAPEDGSICPHEVNVHAWEQFLVWKNAHTHTHKSTMYSYTYVDPEQN